ncbi:MAG: hypothetical protein WB870_09445 [Gallionellaceae bacterium]
MTDTSKLAGSTQPATLGDVLTMQKVLAKLLNEKINATMERIIALEEAKSEIHKRIASGIEHRDTTYRDLAVRIAALENQPTMRYRGVWQPGEMYEPGDVVTHSGSAWHAWEQTRARPGDTTDWQLAVKRGAPGKDAR